MPRVELPAAEPNRDDALAAATPQAVEVHEAYVYLFLVVDLVVGVHPNANMPRVELPAADPFLDAALAAATPIAVEEHEAYVYLFLVVDALAQTHPRANIPTVPSHPPPPPEALYPKPNALADIAPRVMIVGIVYPHLNCV